MKWGWLAGAFVVALAAFAAYFLKRFPRVTIPPHLQDHTLVYEPAFIPPAIGAELNALLREMGADATGFPTNIAADLKTGVSSVLNEHIGEAQEPLPDGTCAHPFLTNTKTREGHQCVLPQRVDVGRHFVMTGGPEAIREPYERMVSRVSSFGRYMFRPLDKYPPVTALFASKQFQQAARRVCPADKQLLDPFQFNFILQVPGQTVALHLDAVCFVGATRFRFPQWLLAAMEFSGLFQERFVDQVQVVGYLHNATAAAQRGGGGAEDESGRFLYYPNGSDGDMPLSVAAEPLSGLAVDGSKTLHAAGVFHPWAPPPQMDKDRDNALFYKGAERWELKSDGKVIGNYTSADVRMTLVYRARCFADEAAKEAYDKSQEEGAARALSLDSILGTFAEDLAKRGLLEGGEKGLATTDRLRLAILIIDTYIKYPLPGTEVALIPFNYCALPKTIKVWPLKAALQALLAPLCAGV